ncbi:MAG TPA: DUF4301 family protein [Bacteroidetes bacterium]|nr:DUF4301 family protein [Bacteroidota bacterium]
MLFNERDLEEFRTRGITPEQAQKQIERFEKGFPDIPAVRPAIASDGIIRLTREKITNYRKFYEENRENQRILKLVPASGAATRMFKALYEALSDGKKEKEKDFSLYLQREGNRAIQELLNRIGRFAFYPRLRKRMEAKGMDPDKPKYARETLEMILKEDGLNYGNLPKGLILFHRYTQGERTAAEEHLAEGAHYASTPDHTVHVHFTVSPEHIDLFQRLMDEKIPLYEKEYGVTYRLDFSLQKPSTDTLAVDMANRPFREKDGTLLFRPGGHGALIENLNDIPADVIFIKNIDNVSPDRLKPVTVKYKKALAGILLTLREKIFRYLHMLDEAQDHSPGLVKEILSFLEQELCVRHPGKIHRMSQEERADYCRIKLNRPLRVCGMVKNEGEPGGGPFWVKNPDGSLGLQIAESSQFNLNNPDQRKIFRSSTHFNPVDLVCSTLDYQGNPFYLPDFRDPDTGFISKKSKNGKDLKALELPGLWNGAMANWNTVFVEVPPETFTPVKTVMDLLRKEHLPEDIS